MPPIQMPVSTLGAGASGSTVVETKPMIAESKMPVALQEIWKRKTGAGLVILTLTWITTQIWPSMAPIFDQISFPDTTKLEKRIDALPGLSDIEALHVKIAKLESKPKPFDLLVRAAWGEEPPDERVLGLQQSLFLYRRTYGETVISKDLDDVYKSFRTEEIALGLDRKFLMVRTTIRSEWTKQVPEIAPQLLTEPLRAKLCDFLSQTIRALEKLQ